MVSIIYYCLYKSCSLLFSSDFLKEEIATQSAGNRGQCKLENQPQGSYCDYSIIS